MRGKIYSLEDIQQMPNGQLRHLGYNALDTTGTLEIFNRLYPRLSPDQAHIYQFHIALQGPATAMSLRGVRVDVEANKIALKELRLDLARKIKEINKRKEVLGIWDKTEKVTGACKVSKRKDKKHSWERDVEDGPDRKCTECGGPRYTVSQFNPNSSQQTDHLLHNLHGLKRMKNKSKENSVDEDTLQRIAKQNPKFFDLIQDILAARGLKKQIGFLKAPLTADNRYPSTFNIAAAWTGRFSSSKDPWKKGGNLQNIAERHRFQFIADPGMELAYIDLKQAESNVVAHLAGDERYIEAHLQGDVHTYVTRLVWPELPWKGNLKEDKEVAGANPDWDKAPGHSYRFQSKRIQHGSNYGLTAFGIAMISKLPLRPMEKAQRNYFVEFPFIKGWQEWTAATVEAINPLTTPLGFKITLMGPPTETHTRNQGLSFSPQSTVAMLVNIALAIIWKRMEIPGRGVELLAQVHDALLLQFPAGKYELVKEVAKLMEMPLRIVDYRGNERHTVIEAEIAVGKNWGKYDPEKNPHGMQELKV
jgi:DNA polymerase I-like protein with 3'-5' exonuclease and polymerase domains